MALVAAELLLRALYPSKYFTDPLYGWVRKTPGVSIERVEDTPGNWRDVEVQTSQHGFKRWGDPETERTKLLVLGDSYTEMRFVENGEEWYAHLEEAFPEVEFFVHGTGGFGTLQEYMVLDEHFDTIQPDVVLWQFYFNDFINNDFAADRGEYPLNNRSFRPYLEDGEIVHRFPADFVAWRTRSRLLSLLFDQIDEGRARRARRDKNAFYSRIYGDEFWTRPFEESQIFGGRWDQVQAVTAEIFGRARERVGEIPMYLFSVESEMAGSIQAVCDSADITYLPGLAQALDAANRRGIVTKVPNDGHWNLAGNRVAGEFLAEALQRAGAFDL